MTPPRSRPGPPAGHTPKPITPQLIRAKLRKAGLPKSDGYMIGVQPHGWQAYEDLWGARKIIVKCQKHPCGCDELNLYLAALAAAGIAARVENGAVWVPVDQPAPDATEGS
jgi:hypothetical protein